MLEFEELILLIFNQSRASQKGLNGGLSKGI